MLHDLSGLTTGARGMANLATSGRRRGARPAVAAGRRGELPQRGRRGAEGGDGDGRGGGDAAGRRRVDLREVARRRRRPRWRAGRLRLGRHAGRALCRRPQRRRRVCRLLSGSEADAAGAGEDHRPGAGHPGGRRSRHERRGGSLRAGHVGGRKPHAAKVFPASGAASTIQARPKIYKADEARQAWSAAIEHLDAHTKKTQT